MAYEVTWSDEALLQLEHIHAYLSAEVSAYQADYVRESIVGATDTLEYAPYIYPLSRRRSSAGDPYRTIPKWNYLIHFSVEEEEGLAIIVAVEHAHRDT